jgi:minor extracellular serine protease Vpr
MKNILISLTLLTMMISCSKGTSDKGIVAKILAGDYFSMRQQGSTTFIGIIQLKNPSLLKDAKIVNGKAVIDQDLKQAIVDEQDEMVSKLENLSSDIKIIARYKMVLNAIAYTAPNELTAKIQALNGVSRVLESTQFKRPGILSSEKKTEALVKDLNAYNTNHFIGADKLHALGISGQNMKVGVIDTGIDYTHKMLGGPGTAEAYKSVDPNGATSLFPNEKVVGGVDFAGTNFNAASDKIEDQIPLRDANPIDEAEHGTHVSGTVAGLGDGLNTYSGIAPDAKLYALKVFGKEGSTSDITVIQALEYAADITESQDPNNHLDVVNLSLGGSYGKPKILYTEAVRNLTRAGTIVVASAGNSGDEPYIVGAPSTSDEAISIAASIDDLDQNIVNKAIEFKLGDLTKTTELVEGTISTPAHTSKVTGALVYLGNGVDPISDDAKASVSGKIALMDRGAINFVNKLQIATDLGAIGVVVANNQDGAPIEMGGDGHFDVPAVMISKALGTEIKEALASKVVTVQFSSDAEIRHVEKIDQITDFSSRGPRSIDSLIKPEIAAPGANIISAKCGSGTEGVMFSGTSMASPHMAGVMALLRQAFPNLSVEELKAKVMNTSKILYKGSDLVPVSLQGAGRVQVESAYKSKVIALPASLSLGEVSVASNKKVSKTIVLKNISDSDIVMTTKVLKGKSLDVSLPASIRVKANSTANLVVSFNFKRQSADANNLELDGFVTLGSATTESIHLPFLGIMNKVSDIKATDFVTQTNSKTDLFGSEVDLTLKNSGTNEGEALLFNLLGTDDKKVVIDPSNLSNNTSCDLESAGVRIIERETDGKKMKLLQVGVKLYDTLTFWQPCDISLQIDSDGDGVADQELIGIRANYVSGISANQIASLLLDAKAAREIRKAYELDTKNSPENYVPAIIDAQAMKFYDHGSVAVIETDLSKVTLGKNGQVGIKLAVTHLEADDNGDDFLASHGEKWQKVFLTEDSFAFKNIPEVVTVKAQDQEAVTMTRGLGKQRLLALFPTNLPVGILGHDKESQILSEKLLK